MLKKFLFAAVICLLLLSAAVPALAHQPRFIKDEVKIEVKNPEISRAFYGELNGQPAVYEIKSDEPFKLYVGVLVPDISGIDKDVSARVTVPKGDFYEEIFNLNGENFEWKNFYEEFAGDDYWQGPEERIDAEAGIYFVTVSSPDDFGKYVLAIGETESFPLEEMANTLLTLPKLKKEFFGKSSLAIFNGRIGMFLGGFILVIVMIIAAVVLVVRKIKRKKIN